MHSATGQKLLPKVITYPEELPVAERRAEIARAIAGHQVVVVAGETGSGKTTTLYSCLSSIDRVARNVGAPDVEEPGAAVRQGQDSSIRACVAHGVCDPTAFRRRAFAAQLVAVDLDRGGGRRGLIVPDRVDRVLRQRRERDRFGD